MSEELEQAKDSPMPHSGVIPPHGDTNPSQPPLHPKPHITPTQPDNETALPAASTTIDPLVHTLVATRYYITQRLARGGMATVYIAHDRRLDRDVALKVMHAYLAEDPQFISRFDREARSAARINHPSVVSVTDQGSVDGRPFLVMDLIDGPNLRELLRAQGAFTLEQSLRYTRNVLQALRAAAREGVIHRDIKPENVMLPADGPARVTDFGLAKAMSDANMSVTSHMLGTVTYMAPEIATSGKADARTDLYSVGIMLFEMLTGAVPWHGDNALHIAYSHVHDDVPSPSSEQAWIPREVDDFVGALTARAPQERLASADEALTLLERVYAALPVDILTQRSAVSPALSGDDTQVIRRVDTDYVAPTAFLPALDDVTGEGAGGSVSVTIGGVDEDATGSNADTFNTGVSPSFHNAPTRLTSFTGVTGASQDLPDDLHQGGAPYVAIGDTPKPKKRRAFVTFFVVLALLIPAGAGGAWWWFEFGPGSYIALPVTDGRPVADVRKDLETLGFSVEQKQDFSDTVTEGAVISSVPASATSAHKDTVITLVVSKGVDMRVVPDLKEKAVADAEKELTAAGFTVGNRQEAWSEDIPAGHVVSQSHEHGTKLRVNSQINVVVSKGREPRQVPDLVGKTREEVEATLSALELQIEAAEAFSDTVEQGRVISQETTAATKLFRGDKVKLTFSKGPELVAVPDITGKTRQQAVEALEAAGFHVEVNYLLGGIFGTAHSTDPGSGTMLKRGSTVTLTVV